MRRTCLQRTRDRALIGKKKVEAPVQPTPHIALRPETESQAVPATSEARGFWLRTSSIEAYVETHPAFRLLSVRSPGGVSLMADHTVSEKGLRLAFMEPAQSPASFDVGNQPAEVMNRTASTVRVRLSAAAGLRYRIELSLEQDAPRLHLACSLENTGAAPRTVACWSVISFARGNGLIVAPFGRDEDVRRRLVLPPWTPWPQPGVQFGRDTVVADTASPLRGDAYKVGLITDAGWVAFVRDGDALVDSAPFDASATYPEDGANVTFFEGSYAGRSWCEIERVGPLKTLAHGEKAHLSQTLSLIKTRPPHTAQPDTLRRAIEARIP